MEKEKKGGIKNFIKGFFFGLAMHHMTMYALKMRGYFEHMFMIITLGDLLGIPFLPRFYSLRLLPYAVPRINSWKRRFLKERDLTDILY